jgi:RHS repeat-associated protein
LQFNHAGPNSAASGDLSHYYLHGPAVDQVLADETRWYDDYYNEEDAEVYWLLGDNQNTVRDVVAYDYFDYHSVPIDHIRYDSFGNITSQTNAGIQPHFTYTGREFDSDTGLYYYRARWYDAVDGRFISEDPSGFNAGDANLYRYCGNGPTNATDPTGYVPGPGGEWLWMGSSRGFQLIIGYYYYNVKFTCTKSLLYKVKIIDLGGGVCIEQNMYKVPTAVGAIKVIPIGAGVGLSYYQVAAGKLSGAPTSDKLSGWGWSLIGASIDLIIYGAAFSGGGSTVEGSAGNAFGAGVSISTYPSYTTIYTSTYEPFEEPLSAAQQAQLKNIKYKIRYKNINPPKVVDTPSSFHYGL